MKGRLHLIPWVLFAGPISLFAAAVVLFAARGSFEHGPGVPTAGREGAWNAMWTALGLVTIGHVLSLACAVALVALRLARRQRFEAWLRWGLAYAGLVALPLLAWLIWA